MTTPTINSGFIPQGLRRFSDIKTEIVDWYWHRMLPVGKMTELIGDPAVGKSWLSVAIVSVLTKGEAFPFDEIVGKRDPMNCLIISSEDGPEDTIKPRLEDSDADMEYVYFLDHIPTERGKESLNLKDAEHRKYLEKIIVECQIGFIVIDPIDAYLGGVDTSNNSSVRSVLTPLCAMLTRQKCTWMSIRHLNKSEMQKLINRANGSVGFTASSRSSFIVGTLGDSGQRAIVSIKSNLCEAPDPVGYTITGDGFEWSKNRPDVQAMDLALSADLTQEEVSLRDECQDLILETLPDDGAWMKATDLQSKIVGLDSYTKTTYYRARSDLLSAKTIEKERVTQENQGKGYWAWRKICTSAYAGMQIL